MGFVPVCDSDGGFCAIPGSHKSNFACPSQFESLDDPGLWLDPVRLKSGSALVFTEALTHGTMPWTADHERRALFYRYTPGYMASIGRYRQDGREEIRGAYPVPSDVGDDNLSPELSRMLEPPYQWERPETIR